MLGDSVISALEEQEKNKHKRKKQEKEKEKEKKINNKYQKEENNISFTKKNKKITNEIIPGDSEEINTNEININKMNKINLPSNIKKINQPIKINNNNNNINNQEYFQPKINKKKMIQIPKSNNNKYSSKSPDQSKINKNKISNNNIIDINQSPDKIVHRRSNSNNDIKDISKSEIIKKIKENLKDVDQRYLNPSFNLMSEIINIFGDINFEKVKQDIERLKLVNEKLDDIIKIIVDKHSEEFFQILGYVRETKNIIESSKVIYDYAQVSLGNLTSNVSSLAINENKEWKLQSIFLNEIITRLSKTLHIFEILHECEEYIRNDKLLDAMNIINETKEEHLKYDKEFRNYNLLVTINIRFIHIQKEINLKIITGLNQVIFFDEFKIKDEFYKEHKEKEVFVPLTDTITNINDESNNTNNNTNDNTQSINENNNNENKILNKKVDSSNL